MSTIKFKRGNQSNVGALPKEDGSLIFAYDVEQASPATVQLDQTINNKVERLNLFVANSGTSIYSSDSYALGGSSLQDILNVIDSKEVSADSATRIIPTNKSVVNNFSIRTGIPTASGWSQFPIFPIAETDDPDLISYKGKNLSVLHMDGGAQRHDIVALNEGNDGLLYATASSQGETSRIEKILDGGNYSSLVTNLNKEVTFENGLRAKTNVQIDGGNFSTGSTVTTGNGETSIPNIRFVVSGKTLIITTK